VPTDTDTLNCIGATTSSIVCTVPPTQTLSKLYRCHNKLHSMHSATDTDTLQTVPAPQQAPLYAQCHRHRHSPNSAGATTSSTVCTVPTDTDTLQTVPVPQQAPLYAQCLPTQTLSQQCRCHNKLHCMHSAYRHSRYRKCAHSFFTCSGRCSDDVS